MTALTDRMTAALDDYEAWQGPLFEDFHRRPELSMREVHTRRAIAERLTEYGYAIHEIGGGVVGVLDNGAWPTVLMRARLRPRHPHRCRSGRGQAAGRSPGGLVGHLPRPVPARGGDRRRRTVDGRRRSGREAAPTRCVPGPARADQPAGREVAVAPGPVLSSAVSMKVVVRGSGSHGSMPHLGIDPVVLAAAIVTRLQTLVARELGHLVLHGQYVGTDLEEQANAFAAAFLMPEAAIGPDLRNLTLGKLLDLKTVWGVSMQAVHERAFQLRKVTAQERTAFYKQMSKRGWRTREPGSDLVPEETPQLARSIGDGLRELGLSDTEVHRLIGASDDAITPFASARSRLRAVRT